MATGETMPMTNPSVIRFLLQNLADKPRSFSLEPYGDYCELEPQARAYATWEPPQNGRAGLEIAVTNDAVSVWESSEPSGELRPVRDGVDGDPWARA